MVSGKWLRKGADPLAIYDLLLTIYRPRTRQFERVSSNARRGGGMVDAMVSNTIEVKLMRVRVSPPALSNSELGTRISELVVGKRFSTSSVAATSPQKRHKADRLASARPERVDETLASDPALRKHVPATGQAA